MTGSRSSVIRVNEMRKIRSETVRHLRELKPEHCEVAMAITKSGQLYKIDGHTRALMWKNGRLERPDNLLVRVFSALDKEEVKRIYDSFDSARAAKGGLDQVQSGMAEHNIVLQTPWLQKGQFPSILNLAAKSLGMGKLKLIEKVGAFKKELELFDSLTPTKSKFVVGIAAGTLIALRKHGAAALPFFENYEAGAGVFHHGKFDPVYGLKATLKEQRDAGNMGGIQVDTRFMMLTLANYRRYCGPAKLYCKQPAPLTVSDFMSK